MVKQILRKTIALFLVMIMTMGNVSLIGTNVYAAFEELEQQKTESSDKNVSFDTYFQVGNTRVHGVTLDAKQEAYVNFEVKVGNGFLKDSTISLNNANFEIESIEAQSIDGIVKNSTANTIELNQINSNKTVTISAKIKMGHPEYVETNYCQRETTATFVSNYTNIKGKENAINAQINIGISWVANELQTSIDANVQKYMQFGNKAVIETKITSTLNENVLPTKNTNIKVTVPKVGENLPEEVRVHAISTKATNGITNGESFNADNWNYNSESGELTINVENTANQEGKVAWENGTDEYIVTYIYETTETIPAIEIKAQNTITTYTEATAENSIEKTETIALNGNYVDYGITGTEKVSKGYIYANSVYETNYNEKITANISYKDATEGLVFTKDVEAYNTDNGKTSADTYYKSTIISKSNFEKILGQEGQIKIFNGETLLGTIDKNTQPDENGNLVYNYTANYNTIRIETTKPVEEGIINIENNKAIAATSSYNYETQKIIRNIETTLIGTSANQEAQKQTTITNLEETTTKSHIEIGTPNLSTVVTNENVEIRAVLESDDITDDLYKNPTVRIELPEEVESINIKSANVLFGDELQKTSTQIEANRIINVALTGEQTKYVTDGNSGIVLIINADIILNRTAASRETVATMKITNEKAIKLENEGISTTPLNIVAPKGVITLNSVTNIKTGKTATSIDNKEEISLERETEKQTATYTGTIINNNETVLNNISIEGNIPYVGDEYGSTINGKIVTKITINTEKNYKVYYTSNEKPTNDITNTNNGWSEEIQENTKHYLVVLNDTIDNGEKISFTYNVELPENLDYSEKAISTYVIRYTSGLNASNKIADAEGINYMKYAVAEETTNTEESKTAVPVELATEEGVKLEVSLENNAGTNVNAETVITYTITAKNTGTIAAETAIAEIEIPENASAVTLESIPNSTEMEYKEKEGNISEELGTINAGETVKKKVFIKAKTKDTSLTISAKIKVNEEEFNSNSIENKIVGEGKIDIEFCDDNEGEITLGDNLEYTIDLNNKSGENIENIIEKIVLPENIEYKEAYVYDYDTEEKLNNEVKYDKKTRTISINYGELEKDYVKGSKGVILNLNALKEGSYTFQVEVTGKNIDTQYSIINKLEVKALNVEKEITSSDIEYINNDTEFLEYNIRIKNNGKSTVYNLNTTLEMPTEFVIYESNCKTIYESEETNENVLYTTVKDEETGRKTVTIENELRPGEEKTITIYVEPFYDLKEDKEITTKITIERLNYSKEYTYVLEANIDGDDEIVEPQDKYKISGMAWLDSNKNGAMETEETKISGIKVQALDNNGNSQATAITDENGKYTLQGLASGTYTVIFEYDTSKYSLTEYQKEGIEEACNSNVITGKYNEKEIATTNILKIENNSIGNINIGLIQGSKFDLSLNKKVTQISMANTKTTKTKKYNTQLAKIDLDYKYINSTKVAVEYEITVTNEGDIPGYATKIADYLPEGFDFSSELNKDWYTSGKGVETRALEKELINPGESKTVTLVLTKSMTENANGIYSNTAEIAETYNDYAKADCDSTPGNNKEGEDDQSSANVILGLKTGGPITYITLTLSIMAIICIGAYEINKRVLKM